MSYHKVDPLNQLVHTEPIKNMLEAFIKIYKTIRKMPHLNWAHNDLHLDNVVVHCSSKNKLRVTVIDYGLCRKLDENPHKGQYNDVNDLPNILSVDVMKDVYEGDLVDRFVLCRIAIKIARMLVPCQSAEEFHHVVELDCKSQYPDERPAPRIMSRLAIAALETQIFQKFH